MIVAKLDYYHTNKVGGQLALFYITEKWVEFATYVLILVTEIIW